MSGPRILIVEDDTANRRVAEAVLVRAGYQVLAAADARAAFAELDRARPAMILLDLELPGLDGFETARKIRERPDGLRIPIVALTAHALRGDEERARAAGCDDYLAKPCRPALLRERVRHWAGG
jgi:CheY-like chemotaxis protein